MGRTSSGRGAREGVARAWLALLSLLLRQLSCLSARCGGSVRNGDLPSQHHGEDLIMAFGNRWLSRLRGYFGARIPPEPTFTIKFRSIDGQTTLTGRMRQGALSAEGSGCGGRCSAGEPGCSGRWSLAGPRRGSRRGIEDKAPFRFVDLQG
jgi:hypothetical protein